MGLNLILILIGLITAGVAIHGMVTGSVYCKGGPYSRVTQPVAFWTSVIGFLGMSLMMVYFAVKG
ncbi:MAG: hypothetical protein ACAI44_21250 [Candidatus Sericytochromatia bacterium]